MKEFDLKTYERLERDIGYQIDHDKTPTQFVDWIIENHRETLEDRFQDNIAWYLHAVLISGTTESREVLQDIFGDVVSEGDLDKLQQINDFYRG